MPSRMRTLSRFRPSRLLDVVVPIATSIVIVFVVVVVASAKSRRGVVASRFDALPGVLRVLGKLIAPRAEKFTASSHLALKRRYYRRNGSAIWNAGKWPMVYRHSRW